MRKSKVAQTPSSRAVKRNFQHSKLKLFTLVVRISFCVLGKEVKVFFRLLTYM